MGMVQTCRPPKADGMACTTGQGSGPQGDPTAGQYDSERGVLGEAGRVDRARSKAPKPRLLSGPHSDDSVESQGAVEGRDQHCMWKGYSGCREGDAAGGGPQTGGPEAGGAIQ